MVDTYNGWSGASADFHQEHFTHSSDADETRASSANDAALVCASLSEPDTGAQRQLIFMLPSYQQRIFSHYEGRQSELFLQPPRCNPTRNFEADKAEDLRIPNEIDVWREIQNIKAFPLCMEMKRKRKYKLLSSPVLRLYGWKRIKFVYIKFTHRLRNSILHSTPSELWGSSLRQVEGCLGSAACAYFRYIKCVMYLHLLIFTLMLLTVIGPHIWSPLFSTVARHLSTQLPTSSSNSSLLVGNTSALSGRTLNYSTLLDCDAQQYRQEIHTHVSQYHPWRRLVHLVQSSGRLLELTPLLYGHYMRLQPDTTHGTVWLLALRQRYMLAVLVALLTCLLYLLAHTLSGTRRILVQAIHTTHHRVTASVFSGCDFCLNSLVSSAYMRRCAWKSFLTLCTARHAGLTSRIQLIVLRATTHVLFCVYLLVSVFLLYLCMQYSMTHSHSWLAVYMPAVYLSLIGMCTGALAEWVDSYEHYGALVSLSLVLLRTLVPRLASLLLLIYMQLARTRCVSGGLTDCQCPPCWENHIGLLCYRLILTDFVCVTGVRLLIHFTLLPLGGALRHRQHTTTQLCSHTHLLDIVHNQTLTWLGLYFAPALPALAALLCALHFRVKCVTCTHIPFSHVTLRTLPAFFSLISLLSMLFSLATLTIIHSHISPSTSCGPFAGQTSPWNSLHTVLSPWLHPLTQFLMSPWVILPLILFLILLTHYLWVVSKASRDIARGVRQHLRDEAQDKQFLLARLREVTSMNRQRLGGRRWGILSAEQNNDHTKSLFENSHSIS